MSKFIGYTSGFKVRRFGLAKAEFNRVNGGVQISLVSAQNLGAFGGRRKVVVSAEEFNGRENDPYNSLAEARWAFEKLGVELAIDDGDEIVNF
jgi:hypothetical protein